MIEAHDNPRLARQWFSEMWSQQRPELIHELMTPGASGVTESGWIRSADDFRSHVYDVFTAAFPDLKLDVVGTVAEGNQVVVRWRFTATHSGPFFDIAATGHRVAMHGMTWLQFESGRITCGEDAWNIGGLLQALRQGQSSGSVEIVAA